MSEANHPFKAEELRQLSNEKLAEIVTTGSVAKNPNRENIPVIN
ncbi:hypothetical protein [Myxosarcina sp. GI1(2024)]